MGLSTMSDPAVRVDTTSQVPPYEQIRAQLAALIRTGRLAEGERLPTVRQLAADLGLAPGTVARAYRELEATELIRTRRGAGTRVAALPSEPHAHDADQLATLATKMIAASTSRSPRRRCPPPCWRSGAGGTTRWNNSQRSSGANRSTSAAVITPECRKITPTEMTSKEFGPLDVPSHALRRKVQRSDQYRMNHHASRRGREVWAARR